ncbi:MAG: helix-turn-helix transcriptional regulator [Ruminococcaceae bacterium]|nr:helix-turn-helix transcriptional regulator [Oscillospiraceae bacterium]
MEFRILEVKRFIAPSSKTVLRRVVKDYELDLYLKGDRVIYTDGVRQSICAGDICFRYPGQEVYSFGDYDCYIVTLDFSGGTPIDNYSRGAKGPLQPISEHPLLQNIPSVFSPIRAAELKECFSNLTRQADFDTDVARALVIEILHLIRADLCRIFYNNHKPAEQSVDMAKRHIDLNYRNRITLESLAELTHLEKSYLSRIFKKKFHQSPIDYLILLRLSRARDLLLSTDMTINEIAISCGYTNISFFIASYKKNYGMTPAQYRAYHL